MAQQKPKKKPKKKTRTYSREVERSLYALAAGRCEFRGCRKFLLRHGVTGQEGNFGQKAHIHAFGDRGPRALPRKSATKVNTLDNLMLLCGGCHKLVDGDEATYTADLLREFKREHEERIHHVTGQGPEHKSKPLAFLANISKDPVAITGADVFAALFPDMFPESDVEPLDFSALPDQADWYGQAGLTALQAHVGKFYGGPLAGPKPPHVSVLALGPMPLLTLLGANLDNKIKTEFFQKHRPGGEWKWKDGDGVATYSASTVRKGSAPKKVALILSLSGKIHDANTGIPADYTVYEIEVKDGEKGPNPQFLNTRGDLRRFREKYLEVISQIIKDHPGIKQIRIYPAAPAPVAVTCGFDLLPKAHPDLVMFDQDKAKGGFRETITISRKDV